MKGWVIENSENEVSIIQKGTFCTYYLTKSSGSNDSLREWIIFISSQIPFLLHCPTHTPSQIHTYTHTISPSLCLYFSLIVMLYRCVTHRWSWSAHSMRILQNMSMFNSSVMMWSRNISPPPPSIKQESLISSCLRYISLYGLVKEFSVMFRICSYVLSEVCMKRHSPLFKVVYSQPKIIAYYLFQ